jgi:uncharacterized protein (DUF1778 family)
MSQISIDLTYEELELLKARAALHGQSIQEFVLERTLQDLSPDENKAMDNLLEILDERIQKAKIDGVSTRPPNEIFESVCERKGITLDG